MEFEEAEKEVLRVSPLHPPPLRVCVVYGWVEGGGAPLIVKNQVAQFAKIFGEVHFFTTAENIEYFNDAETNVIVHPVLISRKEETKRIGHTVDVWKRIHEARPDLAICHSVRAATYFGPLFLAAGVPLAIVEHADPAATFKRLTWRQRNILRIMRPFAHFVCVSKGAAEALRRAGWRNVHVIYNFLRDEYHEIEPQFRIPGKIVCAGRLAEEKRVDHLIEAVAYLPSGMNWSLDVIGDGPKRGELQEMIRRFGLESRVRILGWRSEIKANLMTAEIFAQTSKYEGFGIALLEAMAAGAACVSYDCPYGPAEIVGKSNGALLVPSGDVRSLTAALERLLCNPDLRTQISKAAKRRALRFTRSAHEAKWTDFCQRVVAGGK